MRLLPLNPVLTGFGIVILKRFEIRELVRHLIAGVIHAEQYIKFFLRNYAFIGFRNPGIYLEELGGNISLKDWQIWQSVDARRIMLCEVSSDIYLFKCHFESVLDIHPILPKIPIARL